MKYSWYILIYANGTVIPWFFLVFFNGAKLLFHNNTIQRTSLDVFTEKVNELISYETPFLRLSKPPPTDHPLLRSFLA